MASMDSQDAANTAMGSRTRLCDQDTDVPSKKIRDEISAANIWKPLETDRQEIRLVTVEDQPVCSLQVVCLVDDPQYEALSYAWGDPKITRPVVLQGMQWLVFWANAFCIF